MNCWITFTEVLHFQLVLQRCFTIDDSIDFLLSFFFKKKIGLRVPKIIIKEHFRGP